MTIPAHPAAFAAAGPEFLTAAFRRFGALGPDEAVSAVTRIAPCPGGSTGAKLFVDVAYDSSRPALHRRLFVKFSRDFGDARRDWQRHEMAGEAALAPVTRQPGFPIPVPEYLFADYHAASGTGLVVTECVAFGEHGIEPHRGKTLDHVHTPEPLPYYRASLTALARLAGADKAGRLASDIDTRFAWDPIAGSADRIFTSEAEMTAQLDQCLDFVGAAPQLFPDDVRDPGFLRAFRDEAFAIRAHEAPIQRKLTGDPDMIALCHWNAHIDNAFFFRDSDGALACGFIDWGRVGRLTFGSVLWGGLSAAHHAIWDEHLPGLLAHFLGEYRAAGGPAVAPARLDEHLMLHIAMMGVARVLAFPEIIRFRMPEVVDLPHALDPALAGIEPARNCLHVFTVFLKLWRRRRFGDLVARI